MIKVLNIKPGSTVVNNGSLYKVLSIVRAPRPWVMGQLVGGTQLKRLELTQCQHYSVPLGKASVMADTGEIVQ